MSFEAVIGLEVHVQLLTASKMFCRCPNVFGAEPNTLICPVCLGYPGTLPVANRQAVDLATTLALALGCTVKEHSVFARKNYFYPDLPKGYQISQFDQPLAEGGSLALTGEDARIRIHRLHLEEDAGKLLHEVPGGRPLPGQSLVDFNRCGVPLVEIVSEPDLRSAEQAQDYLQTLHQVLLYTRTSDGNMEEGSLRCDANVSLRPRGEQRLGTKAEVKNLNSFRNVARAIQYEIQRQTRILEAGQVVAPETRSFEAGEGVTRTLRGKEEAHDYRYFPDPDLPPLQLTKERLATLVAQLPELPWTRRRRFAEQYGLSAIDARELTSARELAEYFESAVALLPGAAKAVANWIVNEVRRELKERRSEVREALPVERLVALVAMVERGELSSSAAKEVFTAIWTSGENPQAAVDRLGLRQVSDESQIQQWADSTVAAFPAQAEQYRSGKAQVLGFLVGQAMKRSSGSAQPAAVQAALQKSLGPLPS
ncbi:MAG: Asp-tRNA(Asn)/Glu-tRNA(Gln) amidotransferase subunit GatB [Acidobacteriota bacterium]